MKKEETPSPTAYMEIIMLASVIDAKEDWNLSTIDKPNILIHTPIDRKPGELKIIMKIKGVLFNMLVQTNLENMVPVYSMKNEINCYVLRSLKLSMV